MYRTAHSRRAPWIKHWDNRPFFNISAIVEKVRLNLDDSDKALPWYDMAVRFLGIDTEQRKHIYNAIEHKARPVAI